MRCDCLRVAEQHIVCRGQSLVQILGFRMPEQEAQAGLPSSLSGLAAPRMSTTLEIVAQPKSELQVGPAVIFVV